MTQAKVLAALALLLVLLSSCGGRSVAGGKVEKVAESELGESAPVMAVARDGTVVISWQDTEGTYERFAAPGKGWSSASELAPIQPYELSRGIGIGFDGRGERAAVWSGGKGLVIDVRRPGEKTPRLRASVTLENGNSPHEIEIAGSTGCGFLIDSHGSVEDLNAGDETIKTTGYVDAFLVNCHPDWHLTRVKIRSRQNGFTVPTYVGNRPVLFTEALPGKDVWDEAGWHRLLYAAVRPEGRLAKARELASFGRSGLIDGYKVVSGARTPTAVVSTVDGRIWLVTPGGRERLTKTAKGPFDATADARGNAVVAWISSGLYTDEDIMVSRLENGSRKTEDAGTASDQSGLMLVRSGDSIFIKAEMSTYFEPRYTNHLLRENGASWAQSNLTDYNSEDFAAASGNRGGVVWIRKYYGLSADTVQTYYVEAWLGPGL